MHIEDLATVNHVAESHRRAAGHYLGNRLGGEIVDKLGDSRLDATALPLRHLAPFVREVGASAIDLGRDFALFVKLGQRIDQP